MSKPLWKVRGGEFAGWRFGDELYSSGGENVGYFVDDIVYSNDGHYLAEMHSDDRIGKKLGVAHGVRGPRARHTNIALAKHANHVGLAVSGWEDPDF
jgi:hypothetical protein